MILQQTLNCSCIPFAPFLLGHMIGQVVCQSQYSQDVLDHPAVPALHVVQEGHLCCRYTVLVSREGSYLPPVSE